jgi:diadenosine tetraphosphate (Ap4A) HIT family hydrolase
MIYSNSLIYIEVHESEIPWLKIFTQTPRKEFSQCSRDEKEIIWEALDLIEKEMIDYFIPAKVNIASFGNMLPRVHWHIMARFTNDSYFPEPMWGVQQREGDVKIAPMEPFIEGLRAVLASRFAAS